MDPNTQKLLYGVFKTDIQINGDFFDLMAFPIRASVSIEGKLSRDQIERYYHDEFGPKYRGFEGILEFSLSQINAINNDFKKTQKDIPKKRRITTKRVTTSNTPVQLICKTVRSGMDSVLEIPPILTFSILIDLIRTMTITNSWRTWLKH